MKQISNEKKDNNVQRAKSAASSKEMRLSTDASSSSSSLQRKEDPTTSTKQQGHKNNSRDQKSMESYWENEFQRQSFLNQQGQNFNEATANNNIDESASSRTSLDKKPSADTPFDEKKNCRIAYNSIQQQKPPPQQEQQAQSHLNKPANPMMQSYWENEFHYQSVMKHPSKRDSSASQSSDTKTSTPPIDETKVLDQKKEAGDSLQKSRTSYNTNVEKGATDKGHYSQQQAAETIPLSAPPQFSVQHDTGERSTAESRKVAAMGADESYVASQPTSLDRATKSTGSVPGAFRQRGPDYNGQSERVLPDMEEETMMEEGDLATQEHMSTAPHSRASVTSAFPDASVDQSHALDSLATAMEVSDAEPVVYAKDVQEDPITHRMNMMRVVIILISVALIVTVCVVAIPGDDDDYEGPDPRCKTLPLERQNPALQCRCYNTTEQILQAISQDIWDNYDTLLDTLVDLSILEANETVNLTDCSPKSNAILSIAQTFNVGVNQGLVDAEEDLPVLLQTVPDIFGFYILYNSLGGLDWKNASGWEEFLTLSGNRVFGVDTFFIRVVTSISLSNNNLQGTIPSDIRLFSSLRGIDFSNNPGLVGTLPSALGSMISLKGIRLSDTGLEGSIPTEMGGLDRLDFLEVRNAKLSGSLPSELFTPLLRVLDLSRNYLTGTVPPSIANASRLQALILADNQLSGTLPGDALGKLTDLESITFALNQFSGTIPSELGALVFLEFSSYVDSGLSGSVPESFCEMEGIMLSRQVIADCTGEDSLELECSCCSSYEETSTRRDNDGVVVTTCSEDYPDFLVDTLY